VSSLEALLAGYVATTALAWVYCFGWFWSKLKAGVEAAKLDGIARDALRVPHQRAVAALLVAFVAFVAACSWPSLVIGIVLVRVGMFLLHLGGRPRL
jgi:hypothetical protein